MVLSEEMVGSDTVEVWKAEFATYIDVLCEKKDELNKDTQFAAPSIAKAAEYVKAKYMDASNRAQLEAARAATDFAEGSDVCYFLLSIVCSPISIDKRV